MSLCVCACACGLASSINRCQSNTLYKVLPCYGAAVLLAWDIIIHLKDQSRSNIMHHDCDMLQQPNLRPKRQNPGMCTNHHEGACPQLPKTRVHQPTLRGTSPFALSKGRAMDTMWPFNADVNNRSVLGGPKLDICVLHVREFCQ